MRTRRALLLASLSVLGCARAVPAGDVSPPPLAADAGQSEAERLLGRVDALDAEAGLVLAGVDEALWAHWTSGAALDLARAWAGHEALASRASLEVLRQAQQAGVATRRAALLEQWLLNELLRRALLPEAEAIASLEAGATFPLDGREVPWRDLPRLLANERSAVKRRALWAGSQGVAARLGALLAHREERAQAVLAELGAPGLAVLRARTRELDLEALAAAARAVLAATEAPWRATLAHLAQGELKLPVEALTRADLPRLLKVPAAVDAAFPRATVTAGALETLAALGLSGRGALTLDLSESATKQPLPLTVAPAPSQVRLAFKPTGGLRDEALLLAELGTALALSAAATPHASTNRLGDPARAGVLAALLSGLPTDPAWLAARSLAEPLRGPVSRQARALELHALRRTAALVLLHHQTAGLPEAEARLKLVEVLKGALAVKVGPEEGVRLRLELEDGLRCATELKATLAAAVLRQRLGAGWWASPDAGARLLEAFAPGASQTVEAAWGPPSAGVEATLAHLGLTEAPAPPDAGAR